MLRNSLVEDEQENIKKYRNNFAEVETKFTRFKRFLSP